MSIDSDRVRELARRVVHLTPGRDAGRMIDGVDLIVDGKPAGRMPPRWTDLLEAAGYEAGRDGPTSFALLIDGEVREAFGDVREALYEALASIAAGRHPDRICVEARTPTGLKVKVVRGHQTIGMAIGALQDPPIRIIEGPAILPPYPPGERPAGPKRSRRGGSARG